MTQIIKLCIEWPWYNDWLDRLLKHTLKSPNSLVYQLGKCPWNQEYLSNGSSGGIMITNDITKGENI